MVAVAAVCVLIAVPEAWKPEGSEGKPRPLPLSAYFSLVQSRGVMPFSLAYCLADAWNKGWISPLLPSIQPETGTHLAPSHCWIFTLPEPSWLSQEVLISGNRSVAPSVFRRASVMFRFSRAQRTCSPLMALPLPYFSCALRIASTDSTAAETPRL